MTDSEIKAVFAELENLHCSVDTRIQQIRAARPAVPGAEAWLENELGRPPEDYAHDVIAGLSAAQITKMKRRVSAKRRHQKLRREHPTLKIFLKEIGDIRAKIGHIVEDPR